MPAIATFKIFIFAVFFFIFSFSLNAQTFQQRLEDGLNAKRAGDFYSAFTIFEALAEQGYSPAQYFLGMMYYNGDGVPQNNIRALMWVKLSNYGGYYRAHNKVLIISHAMNERDVRRAEQLVYECWQRNFADCY